MIYNKSLKNTALVRVTVLAVKILEKDLKKGFMKLQVESLDDLWVLFNVIKRDDIVYAKTTRDVRPYEDSESRRIPMVLGVKVKNIEFQQFSDKLRVIGIVIDGPEDYGVKGKYHTLAVGAGDVITVVKERWSAFELNFIEKFSVRRTRTLIATVDYEEACIGLLTEQGIKLIWEHSTNIPSKVYGVDYEFMFKEHIKAVADAIAEVSRRENVDAIVIAGPGEAKIHVRQIIAEKTDKPIYIDSVATGGCKGVEEVLERDVVKKVVRDSILVKARSVLNEFKYLLVKDHELVSYGVRDVYEAVLYGAASKILVVDELLRHEDDETRSTVFETLDQALRRGVEVMLVPGKSDEGIELLGFGGAIALLRYRLQKIGENPP